MSERFELVFETQGPAHDDQIIREYIAPAVERLEDDGLLQGFHFFRYGGEVKFRLHGPRTEIREIEEEQWDQLVNEDTADNWTLNDYSLEDTKYGEQGAILADTFFEVASRASLQVFRKFKDDKPAPVDTFQDEEGLPAGAWLLIHPFFNQQSYGDVGEIEACLQSLQNRLFSITNNQGPDQAREVTNQIIQHMEAFTDSLQ